MHLTLGISATQVGFYDLRIGDVPLLTLAERVHATKSLRESILVPIMFTSYVSSALYILAYYIHMIKEKGELCQVLFSFSYAIHFIRKQ